MEFIKFVLYKIWLDEDYKPFVNGHDCSDYFKNEYNKLDDKTKKKLRYVKKFLNTNKLDILCICKQTKHDGDYSYYADMLRRRK